MFSSCWPFAIALLVQPGSPGTETGWRGKLTRDMAPQVHSSRRKVLSNGGPSNGTQSDEQYTDIVQCPLKGREIGLIPGRLVVDLFPNGTARMVFIAHTGGGNETPLTA